MADQPRERVVRFEAAELVAAFGEQTDQQRGVGGIVFGAAAGEAFAVTGELFGIDRVQQHVFLEHEMIDQAGAGLFQADGDRPSVGACLELAEQGVEGVGVGLDAKAFDAAVGPANGHIVLAVGPVDADQQRLRFGGGREVREGCGLRSHGALS